MSVLMTFRVAGDAAELERRAAANPDEMRAIADKAKAHGCQSHHFFGCDDGTVMVVDEWDSEAGFNAFMADSPEVQTMMREVGATAPPEVVFWRELDTHDAF